jgi:hypothetical protein
MSIFLVLDPNSCLVNDALTEVLGQVKACTIKDGLEDKVVERLEGARHGGASQFHCSLYQEAGRSRVQGPKGQSKLVSPYLKDKI